MGLEAIRKCENIGWIAGKIRTGTEFKNHSFVIILFISLNDLLGIK